MFPTILLFGDNHEEIFNKGLEKLCKFLRS